MSSREKVILESIFGKVDHFFDCKGVIHLGSTTGKPGRWIAHTLCGRKIPGWIGSGHIEHTKFDVVCDECLMLHIASRIANKRLRLNKDKPTKEQKQ